MKVKEFCISVLTLITILPRTKQLDCTAGSSSAPSCDPRCLTKCTVSNDQNSCCDCVAMFSAQTIYQYYRTDTTLPARCSSTCPAGYYPPISAPLICTPCASLCLTCTAGTNSDCLTCQLDAYQQDSTTCVKRSMADNQADATILYQYPSMNPCPPPYYGIYTTKTCQPCPLGCLQCNLFLYHEMNSPFSFSPQKYEWNPPCAGDQLCAYALKCFKCNSILNYILHEGICITTNRCRRYSLLNSTATVFNPSFCYCKPYFYPNGITACSICSWACLTCNGPATTNCLICHNGTILNIQTSQCQPNATYEYIQIWNGPLINTPGNTWTKAMVGGSNTPIPASDTACSSVDYVFGYYGYDTNYLSQFGTATLSYASTSSLLSQAHYGIHFRAKFLFIDDWVNGMLVTFTQGGIVRYEYKYFMQSIIGEYLCGRASHDHHQMIDFTFLHTTTSISMVITVPHAGYQWGIKDVVIGLLKCDTSCASCSGPTQYQCLTCDSNQVAINGDCVCDVNTGFYNNTELGACVNNCTNNTAGKEYMNLYTRTCTLDCPNGTYLFKYINYATGQKYCVDHCPLGMYKLYDNMTCVSICYDNSSSLKQYIVVGSDNVCYQNCPDGYYGDPVTGYCVSKCPDTYYALGKHCKQYCDSTTWAYQPNASCLTSCPTGYYKNKLNVSGTLYNICEDNCSVSLTGVYQFGDNATGLCAEYCSPGGYADAIVNLCLAVCNGTSYQQEVNETIANGSTIVIRTCQEKCNSANHALFGNNYTGICVTANKCPINQYGDTHSTYCQSTCTDANQYGDNTTRLCQTSCSNFAFRQNTSRICVKTCPSNNTNNASGIAQFGDNLINIGYCVAACQSNTYADAQNNRECVYTCSATPVATFGLNNKCQFNCSSTTWADIHQNRTCTTSCTYNIAIKSYGYNKTRMCVTQCPDTLFGVVIGGVSMCVYVCPSETIGLFGNQLTNLCVDKCPAPYFGDQAGNRTCVERCPIDYYAQKTDSLGVVIDVRICVSICNWGWADNLTATCVDNPIKCAAGTYAHESNYKCVIPTDCAGFADPSTNQCVPTCPAYNQTHSYYGDSTTKMCVLICPNDPDTFGDNNTHLCVLSCSQSTAQVRDPQNKRRCVTNCSRSPVALFFDVDKGLCVAAKNCTADTYADNDTKTCQADCNGIVDYYADPVTGSCVKQCQLGWYGYNISSNNGICVQKCPLGATGQWADNFTVLCTDQCSNNTFGLNYTNGSGFSYGICQSGCPEGQYARDTDHICVSDCGNDLWENQVNNTCVHSPYDCPEGTYADNQTHRCVDSIDCSLANGIQYVADNITRQCLPQCPDLNATFMNWADMNKKLCVARCPQNYFGYNQTKTCQTQCRDDSTASYQNQFADPQLRICVLICSATPIQTYGQTVTYTCVQGMYCPANTWAEVIVNLRRCVAFCPQGNATFPQNYADDISSSCVTTCPTYYYGDISAGKDKGKCVFVCPNITIAGTQYYQFSDNSSKTCVTVCPSGTFGDTISLRCVPTCPLNYYAQQLPLRHCVQTCAINTWANSQRRFCQTSPTNCPTVNGSHYYADNSTTSCVKTCPSTPNTWGENSTWTCETDCVTGFKFNLTRVCIDICPVLEDGQETFSDQGMCYFVCITANYYRDIQNQRSCSATCSFSPVKYYKDSTTMRCVLSCPVYPEFYYAFDPNRQCRTDCPQTVNETYYKNALTRSCVTTCPNGTFYDSNKDQCTNDCPFQNSLNQSYYGDPTKTMPICVLAQDCPANYYADSYIGICTHTCSEEQWKYGKYCTPYCPDGYYGDPSTGFCVVPTACSNDTYAQNETQTCVPVCNGTYAHLTWKVCIDICPDGLFGDPITRICASACTNNTSATLHKSTTNNTCVSSCSQYQYLNTTSNDCGTSCDTPYFADRTTQICVSMCPSSPPLYGDPNTNKCVQQCGNTTLPFKDPLTRKCVMTCSSNKYVRNNLTLSCVDACYNQTYADFTRKYCVFNCSPAYSLDTPDSICVDLCPKPYYRDPTTFRCVLYCPTSPYTYYKVINGTDRYCTRDCPDGQFRSNLSFSCVEFCPPSPPTYSDVSSGNCVQVCPSSPDLYADLQARNCVTKCSIGMFTQNLTRTCVAQCPLGTDLYADASISIPSCVKFCSSGYADPYSSKCVAHCNKNPQTYGFMNGSYGICVSGCPYPYVADNTSFTCVVYCGNTTLPYLDKAAKSCVSVCTSPVYQYSYMPNADGKNGTCEKFCPEGTFALLTNNSCVSKCPDGLFGQDTNNTCSATCSLANNRFADPTTNLCVNICPYYNDTHGYYADESTRTCVTICPTQKFRVKDNNTRKCQPQCTNPAQYIDYDSMKCVSTCPVLSSVMYFSDLMTKSCVPECTQYANNSYGYTINQTCLPQCPSPLYADDASRLCVAALSCSFDTFGYDPLRICIQICPIDGDYYGDPVTKKCKTTCNDSYYADPSTRLCVPQCPVVPSLYGLLPNKICIPYCGPTLFADNQTRLCTANCTIFPKQTYADESTNICVQTCPSTPNLFAENITYTCTSFCPNSMFADYSIRKCVYQCPRGKYPTYADINTRECVPVCTRSDQFMQNSTGTCVKNCSEGFADPKTRYCIAVCPNYSYGYLTNRTCLPGCPNNFYAQDIKNMCNTSCSADYDLFADNITNRCVKICNISVNYFAEQLSRKCVPSCGDKFADNSTRFCVVICPEVPALFGENTTHTCIPQCPNETYADNKTRKCVERCPSSPNDTYGDNSTWSCVKTCPSLPIYTWADNYTRMCVPLCPTSPDYYADNSTGRCVFNCAAGTYADSLSRRCVQTCPEGYYGRNSTWRCVTECPNNEFADHLLNLCVAKCSVDPIYYGNPDTHICVQQCPNTTYSFGNPLNQQCVKYNLITKFSGCPDFLYADNSTRLCVPVCPLKQDTYGDNTTWKCVITCPGTIESALDTYSDNSTMMCVSKCPSYPEYYAQQFSRRCVSSCLEANSSFTGSFADNSTRRCVFQCPSVPNYYSDNSTRRCVKYCPYLPVTFADNSTRRCVSICPSSPEDLYGDNSTRICVLHCPQHEQTYADNFTRMCVKVCPQNPAYFGNNITKRCVTPLGCPNDSYADNTSRLCIAVCPSFPDTYGDYSTRTCVLRCPQSPDLYADPTTRTCVSRCPDGLYADNITRRCLQQCPTSVINYADNVTNRCVAKCPASNQTYGDNSTRKCVYQCPDTPFTYADNITRTCLSICINVTNATMKGGYAENGTRVCVQKCPNLSYGDILTRYCVHQCPNGYFAYPVDNLCLEQCPQPYYADNSTWLCVLQCPRSQITYGQNVTSTCTPLCPEGTYADSYSQRCVNPCPGALYDTYAYEGNRTCQHECPYPLFAYPVNWTCMEACADPYYQNITDHRCYKCPDPCASCLYPQQCTVCNSNFYLYAGSCLASCPTFPTITYANPNGVCGTAFQCPAGYFALNTTKSCVQSCPAGFYKNSTQQACDACIPGCTLCLNASQCITCNDQVALWDNYTCYLFCSPGNHYYSNEGCVQTCPAGTYLQLVSCLACAQICLTCIVQPQNCQTCANGYYLSNNLCVSKCPTNTKAVLNGSKLYCQSCQVVQCKTEPLTYIVDQYVDNYQYKFRLTFNQPVNITQQIDQVIRIMQITKRRLLQNTYTYLDYTIIDYGNGVYEIVLNNFDARSNSDLRFSFQIINPQAIISASGHFPETTRTVIIINSNSIYSLTDYSPHLANYCMIVAIVMVILIVASFWTNQSIWMPIVDYFHWLFALLFINITMPPNPTYALSKSQITVLTFLPNIFGSALKYPQYSKTISSMIYTFFGDLVFLRTMGFLYTVLIVLSVVFLVMFGLWKKAMFKSVKKYCKTYIKQTFVKRDLHGLIYFFFLPTMIISFMKMRDYTAKSAIEGFSIFSSWLFMLLMIIIPFYFAYKIYKLVRDYPITYLMLKKAYEYICSRQVILEQNPIYYFTNQSNEVDLRDITNPRINQILILPYPIQTKLHASELILPLTQYFYKFLIALFLAVAFSNGTAQLFMILLLNLLNIVYFAIVKPYIQIPEKQYNNYVVLHNLVLFSLIIIGMIIFQLQNNAFSYDIKILIGNIIAGLVVYSMTANTIYFAFRVYNWYYTNLWKPFVLSEIFKENYTLQYWDYTKHFQLMDKQHKGKTGKRQEFLEAIKVQRKQDGLQSMVQRDPNQSKISEKKPALKPINLRPNRTQQLKKQIKNMFQTFNDEKQKSQMSLKTSSERLSKQQRGKVREVIFGQKDLKQQKDNFEAMKIEQHKSSSEQSQQQATQYQYQYIQQQYPEGTDIQEILKDCKKGQIIIN